MSNKVFLSHAHKDNEIGKELAEKLNSKKVDAWFDEFELRPGESWEQQIKDAVIKSNAVVLVLGEGKPSPTVLVGAGMALGQGKQIVPVAIGEEADVKVFSNLQQVYAESFEAIDFAADQIKSFIDDQEMLL